MNVTAGNEVAVVQDIESDGNLVKVRVERTKLRGSKKAKPEISVIHLNTEKKKFTSWPKKWGDQLRDALRDELLDQIA